MVNRWGNNGNSERLYFWGLPNHCRWWLQSWKWLERAVHSDFGAQENKILHCFYFFPFYLLQSDGTRCHDLSFVNVEFWMLSFKTAFSVSSFTLIKRLFSLHFLPWGGVICVSELIDISPGNLESSLCFFHPSVSHDVLCIYNLDVLLFLFGTSPLFHVWFQLLLLDLHTDTSGGRKGGLVFSSL